MGIRDLHPLTLHATAVAQCGVCPMLFGCTWEKKKGTQKGRWQDSMSQDSHLFVSAYFMRHFGNGHSLPNSQHAMIASSVR